MTKPFKDNQKKLDLIRTHILSLIFWRYGSQTCLWCVVQAACRALELAKDQSIKKLVLYTDSKFTINGESKRLPSSEHAMATWSAPVSTLVVTGVTRWVKTWKNNGWRLKSGGSITNKEDFMQLDRLNAELDVVWVSIRMHPLPLRHEQFMMKVLSFRYMFLAMRVTMAMNRLTDCQEKEL